MADVNPAPTPDPVHVVGHPRDFCIFCFRDWCQEEAARLLMDPTEYSTYLRITLNYCNQVTPYDEFQMQLKTLLESPDKEYRHLQPYWDVFHRRYIESMPLQDDPLFFYPIDLWRRLSRISEFVFDFDPEQNNRIHEHNRIESDRINAQIDWCNVQSVVRCPYRERNAPILDQAPLEGAADNKVETQTDTPQKRPYRKRNAANLEQGPVEGAADNGAETQMHIPQRKRSYRKRNAPNLEQAPLEGAADNEVETETDTTKV